MKRRLYLRLDETLRAELDAIAARQGLSVSGLVRHWLTRRVAEERRRREGRGRAKSDK